MIQILVTQLNESVEIQDIVYYVTPTTQGASANAFSFGNFNSILELGAIIDISTVGNSISLTIDNINGNVPVASDFLMFSKNKVANTSGLLGYYADINFVNNSNKKAELFAVGSEASLSSK